MNKKTEAGPCLSACVFATFVNCTGGFQDINESQSIVQQGHTFVVRYSTIVYKHTCSSGVRDDGVVPVRKEGLDREGMDAEP